MINKKARVGIILSVYEPNIEFLKKQIASIRQQTYSDWQCQIFDDSTSATASQIVECFGGDTRFFYNKNRKQFGSFHNFEQGLLQCGADYEFLALSDQDDIWHPEKLSTLLKCFSDPEVLMAHSDLRAIDSHDNEICPSVWQLEKRHVSIAHPISYCLRNPVTGCASMIRSSLVNLAMPFPLNGRQSTFHHDTWLAIVASINGKVHPVPTQLVNYRHHNSNQVGVDFSRKNTSTYLVSTFKIGYIKNRLLIFLLLARTLNEFLAARKVAPTKLPKLLPTGNIRQKLSFMTHLLGLPLSLEEKFRITKWLTFLFIYKVTKYLMGKFCSIKHRLKELLKKIPFLVNLYRIALKKTPVDLSPTFAKSEKITYNIVFPSLNPENIFGGVLTGIKLGAELIKNGHSVRFLALDFPIRSDGRIQVKKVISRIFNIQNDSFEVDNFDKAGLLWDKQFDIFIGTAWWTVEYLNIFKDIKGLGGRTYYLVQDYECGFYPWSSEYVRAGNTYRLKNFTPIINCMFLANFLDEIIPNYSKSGYVFSPFVDQQVFHPPTIEELNLRKQVLKKRIFIYGRPQTPRNLYPLLLDGLRYWAAATKFKPEDIEIVSAGEHHPTISLPNGFTVRCLGKIQLDIYPDFLRQFDVGISLMLSPHPSYPPLELAASGVICVSNDYHMKSMNLVSSNFEILDEMTAASLSEKIELALVRSHMSEARIANSRLSFNEPYRLEDLGVAIPSSLAQPIGERIQIESTK